MAAPAQSPIDNTLVQLEKDLRGLQILYEQHFSGILKLEPVRERDKFNKSLQSTDRAELKSTAQKFKYQTISTKFIQYQRMWEKTHRQIEEGTYKRDLFLLEKRSQAEKTSVQSGGAKNLEASPAPAPTAANAKVLKQLEDLYDKVKAASDGKQKLPEKQKFIANLQQQLSKAKEQNPGRPVTIGVGKDSNGKIQVKIQVKTAN